MKCLKCGNDKSVKNGHLRGQQRYRCKQCGYQFTRETPRGTDIQTKSLSVTLYVYGLSFRSIARLLKVSPAAVLKWVRAFAISTYEKPAPTDAVIVELDEMWHFLTAKKTSSGSGRLIVALPVNSLTGNVAIVMKPHSDECSNDWVTGM